MSALRGAGDDAPVPGALHHVAEGVDGPRLPCRVNDPELWFAESPTDIEHAKSLCTTCPVREGCLEEATRRGEPWGVWGGQLFAYGEPIPHKRPRGRPRKHHAA